MTQNNTKKSLRNSNFAAAFLGATGLLCFIGLAGTMDVDNAIKEGYTITTGKERRVLTEKDISSPEKKATLAVFGLACCGGAAALAIRNQRTK